MKRFNSITKLLLSGVAATAIVAGAALVETAIDTPFAGTAQAQSGQGKGQGGQGAGGGQGGGSGQGQKQMGQGGTGGTGGKGGVPSATGEDEDSDKRGPKYSGGKTPGKPGGAGTKKGDLFGDMWVILRNEDGTPVYVEIVNEKGETIYAVQPLDADGNPIPLDAEGMPIDADATVEVELGRLNVGRAPNNVFDQRLSEVLTNLSLATAVTTDVAGRLVLTIDGEEKTIDSPLENLALYMAIIEDGTINPDATYNLGSLSYLNDGQLTQQDIDAAASFLAAANDKAATVTLDEVAYINNILGAGTITDVLDKSYVDYSTFAYDRSDAYTGLTVEVLRQDSTGAWVPTTVNVYDEVFGSQDFSDAGGIDAFTQAADDARAVINFIHEYEVPAPTTN